MDSRHRKAPEWGMEKEPASLESSRRGEVEDVLRRRSSPMFPCRLRGEMRRPPSAGYVG